MIPNLERRWRETDSATVREELGKYRNIKTCPDCGGSRLRPEARNVLIGQDRAAANAKARPSTKSRPCRCRPAWPGSAT